MTTDAKTLTTRLGDIGTITTVIQTFDDSDEVRVHQTLTLKNSNETSVIEITNSNYEIPLIGYPEDVEELDALQRFLTTR